MRSPSTTTLQRTACSLIASSTTRPTRTARRPAARAMSIVTTTRWTSRCRTRGRRTPASTRSDTHDEGLRQGEGSPSSHFSTRLVEQRHAQRARRQYRLGSIDDRQPQGERRALARNAVDYQVATEEVCQLAAHRQAETSASL